MIEYKWRQISFVNERNIIEELNPLGDEGWEVIFCHVKELFGCDVLMVLLKRSKIDLPVATKLPVSNSDWESIKYVMKGEKK